MIESSPWKGTPRHSIEAEVGRRGRDATVRGCRALVQGDAVDPHLLLVLGGPSARKFLDGQPHRDDYWLRVWGLRGLLWVWADDAIPEVRQALDDPAWRAREMALKVVARHRVEDLIEEVAAMKHDPIPRVRYQAERCMVILSTEPS